MDSIGLSMDNLRPHWYAAYTLPRHEKVVAERLIQQDVVSYLPLYSAVRCWNGRRAKVELPLFPGYVFVRMPLSDKSRVLSRPGIINFVSFGSRPAALPDDEVERMRSALTYCKATPYPFLIAGKRVKVTTGPFAGLEGTILRRKGKMQLVVRLDLIQSSMVLEVNADAALLAS